MQAHMQRLIGRLMEAEPEARPILRRVFFLHATRDWAAEVPEAALEAAASAMTAMHRA
jgi:hypothetical protein